MAEGNGHTPPVPRRNTETAPFVIGGVAVEVPALNLETMDRMKDQIRSLSGDMTVVEYAATVISIITAALAETRPELTESVLRAACSFPEMRLLVDAWNGLLVVSGFPMGEAEPPQEAANPGTGTSTGLLPALVPEGFVAETPIS